MIPGIVAFGTSLLLTAAALPLVRWLLHRHDVLDHVNERSSHVVATPRGGGIGVLLGAAAGLAAAIATDRVQPSHSLALLAGVVVALAAVGLHDDMAGLGALPRLAAQGLAGAVIGLIVAGGQGAGARALIALVSAAVMILLVNTVNFMDGVNGITALTIVAWGATMWIAGLTYDLNVGVAAGAVALGTSLAFLPFNLPRAQLFLGDVGSYFYGALVGGTAIVVVDAGVPVGLVLAPLIPHLADVLGTLVRRAREGARLTESHRDHLYQRLTHHAGWTHAGVSSLYGVLALACGASALWLPNGFAIPVVGLVGLGVGLAAILDSTPVPAEDLS